VMHYVAGAKVNDVEYVESHHMDPVGVGADLSAVWARMIFETGTVHCDPHPGNVLVTDDEAVSVGWWGWLTGAKAPHRLVLLDHGLYRRLDTAFRENYCRLWAAMVLMDSDEITRVAERMGLGRYAQWLPLIFTYRASGSSTLSGERMLPSERDKLRDELRGELDVSNISDLLYSMPEDMLFVARTQALLRNSCRALGCASSTRFLQNARAAARALWRLDTEQASNTPSTIAQYLQLTVAVWRYTRLCVRLQLLELRLWWRRSMQQQQQLALG